MLDRSPNMTRLVDKLIEKELVERRRCCDDRRVIYVQNTVKGLALLKEIDAELEPKLKAMPTKSNITAEEAATLSTILDKLREGDSF